MSTAMQCAVRRPTGLLLHSIPSNSFPFHSSLTLRREGVKTISKLGAGGLSTSTHHRAATATAQQHEAVKSFKEIPGPPHWPILGCLPYMLYSQFTGRFDTKRAHKFFAEIAHEFGPMLRLENPLIPNMVVLTRPEDCELLIRATMNNPIRDSFTSLKKIRQEAVDDYFEGKSGLLSENGDEWWRVRSRVQTPMMKSSKLAPYIEPMDEVTQDFMDRMASLQHQHGEMPSDFQTEIYKWALESVGLVALNRRLGCLASNQAPDSEPMQLINLVNEIFACLNNVEIESSLWKIIPTKAFRTLRAKHHEFLQTAERHILETEAEVKAKDADDLDADEMALMETLMLTPGLSRKDVITLMLDMLLAGVDTTSHTMAFALYLLARNPEKQRKLQEEVDEVLGDGFGDRPLTSRHLAKMSYMKAVVKETLRLFPLANGMLRTLDSEMVIGGYLIPKGWNVFVFNLVMGWDEKLFPRAQEFIPERWQRHKPLGPIHPFASLPFGAGMRMCIGRRIAEQEMFIFLTRVMQRFNVDYQYEDMAIVSRLVSTPSQPLRYNITERR